MSYTLLSQSNQIARKTHKCTWCGETIKKGDDYHSERSIYQGCWQYHKFHLECNVSAVDYGKEWGGSEFEFDEYEMKRGEINVPLSL